MRKSPLLWFLWFNVLFVATVPAEIVISEFMASNRTTLADEDGEFSDWIEINNTGGSAVDLAGWLLTDDENFDPLDPESVWTFPSRVIAAGEHLIVFASGKNRSPAGGGGELHTSFQLAAGGEFLALVEPDGVTLAAAFSPAYPNQETDISYGLGQVSLSSREFIVGGADAKVFVPTDGSLGNAAWIGGAEPFDDNAWISAKTGVGYDGGSAPTGFTLVDNFDSLDAGALDGQGGWSASAATVAVAYDPENVENQVMAQTGDNVRAWKTISIADGAKATLFYRMRRDGIVNFGIGTTDVATPGTNFGDFETQLNNQNDASLKVRDAGAFDDVDDFTDATWYKIWMVIDNAANTYKVYMKGGTLANRTLLDAGAQTEFGFRNGPASNAMLNFLARTGGGTTGTWSIDDVYLAGGENLGDPAGGLGLDSFIDPLGDIEGEMSGLGSSAYLRLPFVVGEIDGFASLTLRMRYDDGFVAYLNGSQIAARNAPASPLWDSVATAEHPAQAVVAFEAIDVTGSVGLLVPGVTNLLAVHGLNLSAADGDFLISPELVAISSDATAQKLFFTAPTPGAANGGGVLGFVGDTRFSLDRGFYDAPIDVVISSSTPGATIIYTTDGSAPSDSNGTSIPGPATVNISTTTPLRAAAFKAGFLPTNVDTHTYIFVGDVIAQGNNPPGYPATWKGDNGSGSETADYEMDPEITTSPQYSGVIGDALMAVPTISLVTEKENLFDRGIGIYQNPEQHGSAWERPVSFEIIQPDGSQQGIQVDAGIRIQGGHTRLPSKNPKHSFRLSFTSEFGPTKLNYDLFPGDPDAAKEFDQIVLRGAGNQSWLHHNNFQGDNRGRAQYIRDQWAKDTQLAMGHPAVRSMYAHVYINGIYWGLYNPTERGTAGFGESYLGGAKEDYNTLNSGEAVDGPNARADYNALIALANGGLSDAAAYAEIGGLLDLEAFTDYMLIHQYGANLDWDHHNWYALRNRNGGKWYFLSWDSEFVFINANDNVLSLDNADDPTRIWRRLLDNPEYRLMFADRVQKHLFNGGLLTPDAVMAMWDRRKDQMFEAIVGESARWGDYRRDVDPVGAPSPIQLYDRDQEWAAERTRLFNTYFPVRTDRVIAQYRTAGYFPALGAPLLSVFGGRVPLGQALTMSSAGGGDIFFTTDGSDPRLPASVGGLSLLAEGAAMRVFIPSDDALGTSWHGGSEPFSDGAWLTGTAAGFENSGTGFANLYDIDLLAAMYPTNSSCYVRMAFTIPDQATLDAVASLSLGVRHDDGFAAFINGVPAASANAPAVLTWDGRGSNHPDTLAVDYQPYAVDSAAVAALRLGANVLAIHAFNSNPGSSDFLIDATLDATLASGSGLSPGAQLYASAISINQPALVRARVRDGGEWSPLVEATFFVGTPASDANLVISEIMYNPGGADDAEFIEMLNIAAEPIDLSGVRFSEGVDFEFPLGSMLAPGARALVVRDALGFGSAHGPGLPVSGEFVAPSALDNAGEQLTLLAQDGSLIRSLRYNDKAPWPTPADGDGFSLVLIRPVDNPDHALPQSWRASGSARGNPGSEDSASFTGDANADDDDDGASALLEYALGTSDAISGDASDALTISSTDGGLTLSVRQSAVADDVVITVEASDDLAGWESGSASLTQMGATSSGDGTIEYRYEIDVTHGHLFLRLKATQR